MTLEMVFESVIAHSRSYQRDHVSGAKINHKTNNMNLKLITQHLKSKGFTIAPEDKVKRVSQGVADIVAAYNLTTNMIVSWVIPNNPKNSHTLVICHKDSSDVRFKGKISNIQQFNLILNAVE